MTREAIKFFEDLISETERVLANRPEKLREVETVLPYYRMAIKALKLTTVKECSTCSDKGYCAIFDNFNIDYCSDYRGGIND